MAISVERKQEIIKEFRRDEKDTGSSEVQIAILTFSINELTEHFKNNPKDHHGRRGLIMKVNKRRRLLKYLRETRPETYRQLIKRLGLRK